MEVARETAFLALVRWHQEGTFVWDFLEEWKKRYAPRKEDLNFAYELACGTIRFLRFLDALALQLVKKLPAKAKERFLLRLGLYQLFFLPNIPRYAVIDTLVELAKKYTSAFFASFLNAILRKDLPSFSPEDLAIRYSYPDFFVEKIKAQYGQELAEKILERGNLPAPSIQVPYGSSFYIQNPTQLTHLEQLATTLLPPRRILDMCAAPGGKTLFLHKRYPDATLIANDASKSKMATLQENLDRFSCKATLSNKRGEELEFSEPFDLIVVDAPCSNSGVLYKCPEARWRLCQETVDALAITQRALLAKAATLLSPKGKIWYMTCSILAEENEQLATSCHELHLEKTWLQLPDADGHEGGFAAILSKF